MTTVLRRTLLGLALLGAPACDLLDSDGGSDDDLDVGVEIPSQEEADAKAAATIDESNADAEFAKLQAEIEGDS